LVTKIIAATFSIEKEKRLAHSANAENVRRTWNPLLRDRALAVSWQNPWKILADFPIPLAVGEQNSEGYSIWLRLYDEIRTFFERSEK
jgi:hypothetical protein